jgi:hypothetical protein
MSAYSNPEGGKKCQKSMTLQPNIILRLHPNIILKLPT